MPITPKPDQPSEILKMNAYDMSSADLENNALLTQRKNNVGELSVLFYQQPIEMVSASGVWMEAADGSRYLDLYNNVPSVGHCHPYVVDALKAQIGKLNTNTRYLNGLVETYLENLKAKLTPLDKIILCCTGSEANDLALRIVRKATGHTGIIVTETAYHGNTTAVSEVSPSAWKDRMPADHIRVVPAPGHLFYGDDIIGGFTGKVAEAIESLKNSEHGFAGFLADSIFSSDGVYSDPAGFLKPVADAVHQAGGLYIADEVQPGFGRTGKSFWGFERHGFMPDLVTMGKPMGNSYPVAGVAASSDLIREFSMSSGYFNTFGGNTLAAVAGQAVLDVIHQESLISNAEKVGSQILGDLIKLQENDSRIAEVRGVGLYIALELSKPDKADQPDPLLAKSIIEALRQEKIMIGAAGRYGNSLKIRPPLCLKETEAKMFTDVLKNILGRL